jgi:hypothetical protein
MTEKKKFHDPMAFVRASDEAPTANVAPARTERPAKALAALPWESAHLAEKTPESMHSIALEAIRAEVEKRVRELVKAEKGAH